VKEEPTVSRSLLTILHDPARLAALRRLGLLDSPTEAPFDRLTHLATRFLRAPVALVSLLDADRQFFKSSVGLPEPWASLRQTPLSHSFCQHTLTSRAPLAIPDTHVDPLVRDCLAIQDMGVVAYLGIPLITADGWVLGTFCVMDTVPRAWNDDEIAMAQALTAAVMTEIELRSDVRMRQEAELAALDRERRFRQLAQNSPDIIYILDVQAQQTVYLNREDLLGYTRAELEAPGSIVQMVHPDDQALVTTHWAEVLRGASSYVEYRLKSKAGAWEWVQSRETILEYTPDGAPRQILVTFTVVTARKMIEKHLRLLESVVVSATDAVLITEPAPFDLPGPRIVYVNDAFTAMTGYRADEVIGQTPRILQGPQTDRAALDHIRAALTAWQPVQVELINYRKDGTPFWIDMNIVPVKDASGGNTNWIAIQRDTTERKQAALLDRDRTYVLELIAQRVDLATVLTESCRLIERQRPGMIASVMRVSDGYLYNGAGPSLPAEYRAIAEQGVPIGPDIGACGTAAATHAPAISSDIASDPRWAAYRDQALRHQLRACWSVPIYSSTREVIGTFALYATRPATPAPADLELLTTVGQIAAIAIEQQQLSERLLHQAFHDELTGLPNRILFQDRLTQVLARAQRQGGGVAVLFIDLDRFKPINDTLGHAVGDQLLQQAAQRFAQQLRSADTLARMSGDEFTVVLDDIDLPQDAVRVAHKLLQTLRQPFRIEHHEVFVSACIGITVGPQAGQTADDLIRQADLAMYRAKRDGRNAVQCFATEMNSAAQARLELETDLRRARAGGEFQLCYQPRVDLRSGAIIGVEALLRWQHPVRGPIAPGVFIPVAEESGQMVALGSWVLREACRQGQTWRTAGYGPLLMAVNVSVVQFAQADFVETVASTLAQTRFPAQYLELELTESMLMNDVVVVAERLYALQSLGVTIAIDDFGTGYSSLAYLQRLPLDRLKIDQMFVRGLSSEQEHSDAMPAFLESRSEALVETIVNLAHSLGLAAVAEGVEDSEQMQLLRELGCDQAQGYLFARPLPAAAVQQLVAAGRRYQTLCAP
jgi:diguanylate cyclase (GGDEF)-like protein/PAS domain S-box-containing protein